MIIVKRQTYLEKLKVYYNKPLIKVITGQRRVGKSYLLLQIKEEILSKNPDANILFIDKEKFEFDDIRTYRDLIKYTKSKRSKAMNYLMIDEVQEIEDFEKALRSLLSDGNFDIYCTGSNSNIFSGKLASLLGGRQIEIRIHGLSFTEFLEFHGFKNNHEALSLYLKYGGLPYLMHLPKNDEVIFDYLKNIYATILYRDVVTRHQIRDTEFLDNLISYLADNTGNIFSANNIASYLKNQKSNKTVSVIINYLDFLEQAYFISSVKRKEIKGKKIFEFGEKVYFEDIGLRNSINGFNPSDMGKTIETVVYNHLCISGYKVFIGKDGEKEIDFIAEKKGDTQYFQVAWKIPSEKVLTREFGNLMKIPDNYPKYVISMDDIPASDSYKGIKHIHLKDFLTLIPWE